MHDLNHEMTNVLDSLRTRGVTPAEATRAATVQQRQLQTRLQDNDYWMATIGELLETRHSARQDSGAVSRARGVSRGADGGGKALSAR